MKMNKKLLALSATFALAAQFGTTATAAQATGDADVEVVQPLTIAQATGLNFGTIAVGSAPGTVSIDNGGVLTAAGPVDLQIVDNAAASVGLFNITGENSLNITVSVDPTTTLTANGGSGGAPMTVTLDSDAAAVTALDGAGDAALTVFGDLAVAGDQAADTYSGTYNVTVFYQ